MKMHRGQNKTMDQDSRHDSNSDLVEVLKRIGIGLLYAATPLGQNSIAQILNVSDGKVNTILKGINKPIK